MSEPSTILVKSVAAAVLGLGLVCLPSPAFAEPGTIRILAGGEDYEGPPILILRADSALVGIVPVNNAVKGLTEKNMTDAEIAKTFQSYEFTVPSIDIVRSLSMEFNNDRWGGSSASGDRNLYIGGVSVGGAVIPLDRLQFTQGAKKFVGAYAILMSNGSVSITRPAEGWEPIARSPAQTDACSGKSALVLRVYAENQTRPSDSDASQLMTWIESIPALSNCKIDIAASTSPSGSAPANTRIARARSDEIAALLVKSGVSDERIKILEPTSGDRSVAITLSP